jgi:uncharacterized protein HemX
VAEEENEQPKIKKESVQKKSRAGLIFGIINSLLIFALAGGGYYLLQQTEDKQLAQGKEINKDDMREIESSKQLNSFQSQLAAMQSQIATFDKEIAGKDNHFTKTLAHFTDTHTKEQKITRKNLMAEVFSVKRQLGKTRGDWLMADAEYLLSVASQRLQLVGDVKTTRMALEAADQRLRESGDNAAFKVRQQIAKEIAALETIKEVDVVGTYASIQLLKDKVEKLAVRLPYAGKPLTESKQIHQHEQEKSSDHGVLNQVLHSLEGYVTVKHSDFPVTGILTDEEVGFVRQQLSVKLEMVKIALVQQNDTLYLSSLKDAKQWLSKNFTNNSNAQDFSKELETLKKVKLSGQLPDVSQSLKMLKDITKLRIETDKPQTNTEKKSSETSKQAKQKEKIKTEGEIKKEGGKEIDGRKKNTLPPEKKKPKTDQSNKTAP